MSRHEQMPVGLVLAAGGGSRLGPLTAERPKALLAVDQSRSILDVILANFARCGISEAVVVAGHRIDRLIAEAPRLEDRHGLAVTIVANPYYASRNNCYSLLLARHWFSRGVLLSNGDTLHHEDVDRLLLGDRGTADLVLAVQSVAPLGEEEMKVRIDGEGRVTTLAKGIDPTTAAGEYIGVALIRPAAADALAAKLDKIVASSPELYYEDAFQAFAADGGFLAPLDIGHAPWTEVDTREDLERARELACLC